MTKQNKFLDRVLLIITALVFGIAWFALVVKLDSANISEEWQRFWGGGLIIYIGCAFAVRENVVFNRNKSIFKNKYYHYIFVCLAHVIPILVIVFLFNLKGQIMPLDIKVYGVCGGFLSLVSSVLIGEIVNKKRRT